MYVNVREFLMLSIILWISYLLVLVLNYTRAVKRVGIPMGTHWSPLVADLFVFLLRERLRAVSFLQNSRRSDT